MAIADWIKEWEIGMHLGSLKRARKQCEPEELNEYFWFSYAEQGQEGPMFEHYNEVYSRTINEMEEALTKAYREVDRLAEKGHKEARIDNLRNQLIAYQHHLNTYPDALSYLSHLEEHLDSKAVYYVATGHLQRDLDAMLGF